MRLYLCPDQEDRSKIPVKRNIPGMAFPMPQEKKLRLPFHSCLCVPAFPLLCVPAFSLQERSNPGTWVDLLGLEGGLACGEMH